MNTRNRILLGGIYLTFLIIVGVRARAIPDFYTDEDLNAWHKFGLRSFYGPWSVIARKPNGDFVSYADYGARVPSDFRPISEETIDNDEDDSSRGIWHGDRPDRQYPSKYAAGLSDFAAGYGLAPQGLAVFSKGVQTPEATLDASHVDQSDLTDNAITLRSESDLDKLLKTVDVKSTNKESKRDILELIGIVGVISDESDSSEENTSTEIAISTENIEEENTSTEIGISTENIEEQTTVNDPSINSTS